MVVGRQRRRKRVRHLDGARLLVALELDYRRITGLDAAASTHFLVEPDHRPAAVDEGRRAPVKPLTVAFSGMRRPPSSSITPSGTHAITPLPVRSSVASNRGTRQP